MNTLRGKKILIFQQRSWGRRIGYFLAKQLQKEGCELAALTLQKSGHDFLLQHTDVTYKKVLNNDVIMEDPKAYLGSDDYSLQEICDALDIDTIWPLVMSLRNHVFSYGDKYYYGYKQNVSDEEIVYYVKAVYKYIQEFFDEFSPDLIIAPNFVALPHIMFYLFAKKRGVTMLGITDCKVQGKYIFTYNYLDTDGPFYRKIDALNSGLEVSPHLEEAKKYIEEFRVTFKQPSYSLAQNKKKSVKSIVKEYLTPLYHIVRWYTHPNTDVLKNLGTTIDNRSPKIILRDFIVHKKNKKDAEQFKYYTLDTIGSYIYFPLQFQPEATIDVVSPRCANQIETARQVAMSLPGEYTLVVKDHPAMLGYRGRTYLEKVARLPNVKLIDYRVPSATVLKGCAMVISPNSTTIAEAAYYKKAAIQLGDLGTTLKLPNVFAHKNMSTLSAKIKDVLAVDLSTPEYEKKLEHFVAAAYDTGFDLDYLGVWEKGEKGLDLLWNIYKKELLNLL